VKHPALPEPASSVGKSTGYIGSMTPEEQAQACFLRQQLQLVQQHPQQMQQMQVQLVQQQQMQMLLGIPVSRLQQMQLMQMQLMQAPSPPPARQAQAAAARRYNPASPGVTQHVAQPQPTFNSRHIRTVPEAKRRGPLAAMQWTSDDEQARDYILARRLMQQQQQQQQMPGSPAGSHTGAAAPQAFDSCSLQQPGESLQQPSSQVLGASRPGSPATPTGPMRDNGQKVAPAGAVVDEPEGSGQQGGRSQRRKW
jgi:hypothetical protein